MLINKCEKNSVFLFLFFLQVKFVNRVFILSSIAPGYYCTCIWLFSADSIGPTYVFVVLTILWYSEIHGGSFGMGV